MREKKKNSNKKKIAPKRGSKTYEKRFDKRSDFESKGPFKNKIDFANKELPSDLVIGRKPVLEAIESGTKIKKIVIRQQDDKGLKGIYDKAASRNIKLEFSDRKHLDELCYGENHQGVVAYTEEFTYSSVEEILALAKKKGEDPFIVILDGVEDTHNLGAIIRTCECAGAHGVIIPKRRSASVNLTVVKTSAGAAQYVKVAKVTNVGKTIDELKESGLWIASCNMGGENYFEKDLKGPVALVLGNEGSGVSRLVEEKCDMIVSIPLMGKIESLNVSNAGAVIMYEICKQRMIHK